MLFGYELVTVKFIDPFVCLLKVYGLPGSDKLLLLANTEFVIRKESSPDDPLVLPVQVMLAL